MKWNLGEPPKDGGRYLLQFFGGIVSTGRWRYGELGEPDQGQKEWRCDCCGRFATPSRWAELDDE